MRSRPCEARPSAPTLAVPRSSGLAYFAARSLDAQAGASREILGAAEQGLAGGGQTHALAVTLQQRRSQHLLQLSDQHG